MKLALSWSAHYKTPLEIKIQPLFGKAVWRTLKSFFQLDHQVDMSLYLTKTTTLHQSKKISWFDIAMLYLQSNKSFGFTDSKSDFISLGPHTLYRFSTYNYRCWNKRSLSYF